MSAISEKIDEIQDILSNSIFRNNKPTAKDFQLCLSLLQRIHHHTDEEIDYWHLPFDDREFIRELASKFSLKKVK